MGERMNAPMLFDFPETIRRPRWDDKVTSVSYDDKEIIRWIMTLHNAGNPFDVDVTYSTGRFWNGLPKPKYKFDIAPQAEGVVQADARNLPVASGSVTSVMFDPPFVVAPLPRPGIIRDRFSCYANVKELWAFYDATLQEIYRILSAGIVTVKCQDIVSGGKQHLSHVAIINMAEKIGFYSKDLFILARENVLWSPNMEHQQHARKKHSYFLVFQKVQP
jgi:hypothetical protein